MSSYAIGTATDYAQMQRERNKNLSGISEWERYFLQPLKEQFTTAATTASQQANYDISGAYAAYKQQQLNLLQNQGLSEGFKEKIAYDLLSSYESQAYQTQLEKEETLSGLNEKLQKTLQENTKQLEESGKMFSDLEVKAIEYLGYSDEQVLGGLGANVGTPENPIYGLGWYDIDEEGNRVLTSRGQDELAKAMLSSDFAESLRNENPELYEFYVNNADAAREMIGGISSKEQLYDPTSEESINRRIETIKKYPGNQGDDVSKWNVAFGDLFRDFNAGRLGSDKLADTIIATFQTYYKNKGTISEYFKSRIQKWAKNISKCKNKQFTDRDARDLTKILEEFGNFGQGV